MSTSDDKDLVFYGSASGDNKQSDEFSQELSKFAISSASDKYKLFQMQRDLKRGKKQLAGDEILSGSINSLYSIPLEYNLEYQMQDDKGRCYDRMLRPYRIKPNNNDGSLGKGADNNE